MGAFAVPDGAADVGDEPFPVPVVLDGTDGAVPGSELGREAHPQDGCPIAPVAPDRAEDAGADPFSEPDVAGWVE